MKTSAVIKEARTNLWDGEVWDDGKVHSCSALGAAGATCEQISAYREAISTAEFSADKLWEATLEGLDEDFYRLSSPYKQLFRFLLMCMAEQYFSSIGD